MPNTKEILSVCLSEVNSSERASLVAEIPGVNSKDFIECWHIQTYIEDDGMAKSVVFYIGFPPLFPYTLPSVYFLDRQYDYMPHVETSRKLCLEPDGTCFKIVSPINLIQHCLNKGTSLLQKGVLKSNFGDFAEEINIYWRMHYNGEPHSMSECLIYKSFPVETCQMDAFFWNFELRDERSLDCSRIVITAKNEEDDYFKKQIENRNSVTKRDALYITSFRVPNTPPYDITFLDILQRVSENDKKQITKYVNEQNGGLIVFKLNDYCLGGFFISKQEKLKKRPGFSRPLTPCYVLQTLEGKHQKQQRVIGYIYSSDHIAQRTAGYIMPEKNFIIAGLGSVGSNLVFYLSGWNNAKFSLIDDQTLQPENIGRHFLGFDSLYKLKAVAMEDYLHSIRPEREVYHICSTIQEAVLKSDIDVNDSTAVFLCTGDIMTNQFVIDKIKSGEIVKPVFILWLEPYAIAAHMVYINPKQVPADFTLYSDDENMLYKHNLITDEEYKEHSEKFVKNEAGCNGEYTNYSGNDVTLMLSAFYPIINRLVSTPGTSICYRWEGNIQNAETYGIAINAPVDTLQYGHLSELPL